MSSAISLARSRPEFDRWIDELKRRAETLHARALAEGGKRCAAIWHYAIEQLFEHKNPRPIQAVLALKRIPVTVEEFVENPHFLGDLVDVWPTLMADLKALNPDVLVGREPVDEAFLGGATGIGKSTLSRATTLYQVYMLTCLRDPQDHYSLEPKTRLIFPLQSLDPNVTRRVLYEPLREMFEAMPYAQKNLSWDKRRQTALELEGGIHVVPLLANVESLMGQAIPGALLDEVNFLRIVERSKRVSGPRGLGGRFDQAEELYNELSQRRKSRFLNNGLSIGCLLLCSSTRYQDDFLDRRIKEVEETTPKNVLATRHKRYEVVPPDRYCGESFSLLVGTERYRTRILEEGDPIPEGARIENIPIEHEMEFRRDPEFALRTIVGVAVDSITPFIADRETLIEAIEHGEELGLEQWVDKANVVLEKDGFPRWMDEALPADRNQQPRFVHIDLSRTRDACGIAVVKHIGMVEIADPNNPDIIEVKPKFAVEVAISIKPSPDQELIFGDLRRWLLELADGHCVNIYMITMDSYQSTDTRQIFVRRGIRTVEISVDDTPVHYEYLRECLYEGRLAMVENDTLRRELIQLERNPETGRVDHPPRGSKDVADAVAGAVAAARKSRMIRSRTGYFTRDGDRVSVRYEARRP